MTTGAQGTETAEPEEPGLPVVGEVVAGKYLVERMLGSGGMGIVVAARNILLDEPVAIKFLRPSAAKDAESIPRFVREAKSAVRIQSEHVVRVQDVSYLEGVGTPYMLMEFLEGDDLGQLVERHGVLGVSTAVDFLCEACEGIAEAHALGIVHRDIKPANLFLARRRDGSQVVKVLDFGISKAIDSGAANPNMTDTRATFGSPTYMSPEQIRSSKRVDFRTDIWALGVCLHEMLTTRPPFLAETVAGLLASIIADAPVPVRKERPDVPAALEAVILKTLEKDLTRRYQTVGDFVAALRPFASPAAEKSISRVLRLSPQSFPGVPSTLPPSEQAMQQGGMQAGLQGSMRPPAQSAHSYSVSGIAGLSAVASAPGVPVSGPAVAAPSSAPQIAHARTERNFNTSNSIVAPQDVRRASSRRSGMIVAAVLGVISLASAGGAFFAFRHRLTDSTTAGSGSDNHAPPAATTTDPNGGTAASGNGASAANPANTTDGTSASAVPASLAVTPAMPSTGVAAGSSTPPPGADAMDSGVAASTNSTRSSRGAKSPTKAPSAGPARPTPVASAPPASTAPVAPVTPPPTTKDGVLNGQF